MKHVKKSVLLWYSPHEMYALVTAVADYPKFLPWCARAEVLWRSSGWLGWNGMKLACGVIRSRHLVLTPEDVSKLLLRYHRYALRFDLTIETVASDLHLLADTTSIDYARLAEKDAPRLI